MKKKNNVKNNTKTKTIQYKNEDTDQMKKFIYILIGVALITGALYFVTAKYIEKDAFQDDNQTKTEVTFDYDRINVGEVFNRQYDKYYVLAYDEDEANFYSALKNSSTIKDKIYILDLSIEANKKYVKESSNKNATKPSELSLISPTLILIENGKVAEYYDTKEEIREKLK